MGLSRFAFRSYGGLPCFCRGLRRRPPDEAVIFRLGSVGVLLRFLLGLPSKSLLSERDQTLDVGTPRGKMRKPTLTLGVADKLAELLAAAPAKPETERAVHLDAVIDRMWPILAKKMREDGWTRAECAAFLKENAIDRSIADIKRSIGRHESSQSKKKPSLAPPRARGDRPRRGGNGSPPPPPPPPPPPDGSDLVGSSKGKTSSNGAPQSLVLRSGDDV
jgi:hypothetical protein